MVTRRRILACFAAIGARAQDAQPHPVRFADLPPGIASRFEAATFDARIRSIERDTAAREREGEFDHLIYFALQSQRFTKLPRIEPALSARQLHESGATPAAARARLLEFLRAVAHPGQDSRLRYFARLLGGRPSLEFLDGEYRRAMQFLYEKEFQRREHLYEKRGHSTDTQVEANYAVWNGLSVLRKVAPETKIARVLIVGPGLDFAPRTALFDAVEPQSFQPYAVADALLSLGLANRETLAIDCFDINARVLEFIRKFPGGSRRLALYSEPGDPPYERYFRELGDAIGTSSEGPAAPPMLVKTVLVASDIARKVSARPLNILTSRSGAQYDLAIATNVLLYFNVEELALALANTSAMLRRGGCFLHNELRGELDELSAAAGLEPLQARTIRVQEGRSAPLFDAFALYRKT